MKYATNKMLLELIEAGSARVDVLQGSLKQKCEVSLVLQAKQVQLPNELHT